jgi:tRNA-Thr(GGU) m(6)t(6)A37 methyltransferase TsaA
MNSIRYHPIGIIHTHHKAPEGTPIQAAGAKGVAGRIEIFPEHTAGLADLTGFSHIIILYHFHLSKKYSLKVKPFLDDQQRGLFATRAPSRPNPIGLSVVRLIGITENNLEVQDVDMVDGSPLLDIKPYVPEFDVREVDQIGWIGKKAGKIEEVLDDGRFST